MKIDVDKIREVIGQGGKVIQKIVAETGAKIDIEEDGTIHIFAVDQESGKAAKDAIEAIVKEPEKPKSITVLLRQFNRSVHSLKFFRVKTVYAIFQNLLITELKRLRTLLRKAIG